MGKIRVGLCGPGLARSCRAKGRAAHPSAGFDVAGFHRRIDAALEPPVHAQHALISERHHLGHEHGGDALLRVEPMVGVVNAGPGEAAGAAAFRHRLPGDHVAETPSADLGGPWFAAMLP
jgi:hypothetical protein